MKNDDLNARLRALGFFALADALDDIIPDWDDMSGDDDMEYLGFLD